jgi:hypothetical protein
MPKTDCTFGSAYQMRHAKGQQNGKKGLCQLSKIEKETFKPWFVPEQSFSVKC